MTCSLCEAPLRQPDPANGEVAICSRCAALWLTGRPAKAVATPVQGPGETAESAHPCPRCRELLLQWRKVEHHVYLSCSNCGGVLLPRTMIDAVKSEPRPAKEGSTNPVLAVLEAITYLGQLFI